MHGVLLAADFVALVLATQLASLVRYGRVFNVAPGPDLPIWFNAADLSIAMVAIWLLALGSEGLYDLSRVFWGTGEYSRVIRALTIGVIGVIVIEYLVHAVAISRGWTALAWVFGCAFVVAGRAMIRAWTAHKRRHGELIRPTLIVGFNAEAAEIIAALRRNPESGLVPVGCLASSHADRHELESCVEGDVPCLGYAGEIRSVVDEHFVDTVLIASSAFDHNVLARMINELRDCDVDIRLSSGLFEVTTSRVMVQEASGIPLIAIRSVSFASWKRAVKRAFDLAVGTMIVIIGTPIWLAVGVAVKIDSPGPVFYRQERVGHGGRPFGMYKFRSMRSDADVLLLELRETGANEALAHSSRWRTIRALRILADGCGSTPSTSFRSSSTFFSARCRLWAHDHRSLLRRLLMTLATGGEWRLFLA